MDEHDKDGAAVVLTIVLAVLGMFFLFCIAGSLIDNKGFKYANNTEPPNDCEKAGGTYVKTNHGYACLKVEIAK